MPLNLTRFCNLALAFVSMVLTVPAWAARPQVAFSKVEASYSHGEAADLERTIDGRSASSTGWSLGNEFGSPQSIVFTATNPVEADLLELSLCFMSGTPHSAFADFSLSFTTDTVPSLDGNWTPLPLLNFSAITCELTEGPGNRILAEETPTYTTGMIPDEIYRISTRLPNKAVSGFRIDVYPVQRDLSSTPRPIMAWATTEDFVLTEFRVVVLSTSTNVALGAAVTATHPLHENLFLRAPERFRTMIASAITDGWPSTLAHPGDRAYLKDFHFEVDLGRKRMIDHISLRQRGDHLDLNRFSHMRIKLYEDDPQAGNAATWQTLNRSDGSNPESGALDVLYSMDGEGDFQGRYIRISSESHVPLSPQLAEIEVYETRTPELMAVKADERILPKDTQLQIPPAIEQLGFQVKIPQTGWPMDQLYRWKLAGTNKDWQTSNSLLLEIACPPAGPHRLVLQAAHSDGIWDASELEILFTVNPRFTETKTFLGLIISSTLIIGILLARYFSQRKIKQLKALTDERSRIAANMHDDVGARLAQIAVLHDVFAAEHDLSSTAKSDLSKLTNYARGAMAALDEAVWTVNPTNNTLTALSTFLMQYADNYLLPLSIACSSRTVSELPKLKLRPDFRHEVALAFKEALQNIVKHAGASEVSISLSHESGHCSIQIADNGNGFSKVPSTPGQDGLINMQKRLSSIKGTCEWLPNKQGGTTVVIKFPLS